ncbi:hypothetical protein CEXT_167381 [Caerostris extrusa]|uniref:Uncharacterized protein n=1 Tax=Caerostris extrusa TaxID=172846 RepID=A0AAV4W6R7_CAEEX|nr:hypothetical protein CEXT_167381 [Caerostris extrusa]
MAGFLRERYLRKAIIRPRGTTAAGSSFSGSQSEIGAQAHAIVWAPPTEERIFIYRLIGLGPDVRIGGEKAGTRSVKAHIHTPVLSELSPLGRVAGEVQILNYPAFAVNTKRPSENNRIEV